MVLVVIRHEDVMRGARVPNELADFILPTQWSALSDAILSSYEFGNFWGCAIEIGVCLCLIFPCIFFCHPCISSAITKSNMEEKIRNLNHQIFQGQPVLSLLDGNVYINSDYILMGSQQNQYMSRSDTYDSTSTSGTYNVLNCEHNKGRLDSVGTASSVTIAQATTVQGPDSYSDQSNYIEVVASPVETLRSIVVTIPPGAGPGSILTVAAPNGTTISVVAPAGSYPGKEIMVQY